MRSKRSRQWWWFVLLTLLSPVVVSGAVSPSERTALTALYDSTGGSTWTNSAGWNGAAGTECSWHGVTCNAGGTAVERLNLLSNNLTGTLPAAIGSLTSMKRLALSSNAIAGPLPPELGSLANLEELLLNNNRFSGEIPPSYAGLGKLVNLDLFNNQLGGTVPSFLSQLKALRFLVLEKNGFSGPIPAGLSGLTALRILNMADNRLSGPIPAEIGTMSSLTGIYFYDNDLTGEIPRELGNLSQLTNLWLYGNDLTGPIPSELGNLSQLTQLYLFNNPLTGEIPRELGQLTNLEALLLGTTRLGGTIPVELGNLTKLVNLEIAQSRVNGTIPRELGNLVNLRFLRLDYNALTGEVPPELGALTKLEILRIGGNKLSGTFPGFLTTFGDLRVLAAERNRFEGPVPTALGTLTKLEELLLGGNRLTGSIPPELGQLTKLRRLDLSANGLTGEFPAALTSLTSLPDDSAEFFYNGLYSTDPSVISFVNRVQRGNEIEEYQTLTPRNVRVSAAKAREIVVSWDRIRYTIDPGGYRVEAYQGSTLVRVVTTASKFDSTVVVDGLAPSTTYGFVVRAVTFPFSIQQNEIVSGPSQAVFGATTTNVPSPAQVVVTSFPFAMVQTPGSGGGIATYTLQNFGDAPASLTISQTGSFFMQNRSSVELGPGLATTVQLDGLPQSTGAFNGEAIVSGTGAPAGGLKVPVSLLSIGEFQGRVIVDAEALRVDVSAPAGENPSGAVTFVNRGTATMNGMAISDVAWLVPQTGLVTIPPGASRSVSFTVNRSLRPDGAAPSGAATGNLVLVYPQGTDASGRTTFGTPATSLVTVVDTVKPGTASGTLPPLGTDEVALFLPGVGHVVGGVGLFLSDLTLTNASGSDALSDVKMFFTPSADVPTAATTTSTLAPIVPGEGVKLADVVTTVFGVDQTVGSLQIRTSSADSIFASSNIFNVSNAAGTYGTVIPTFRSDRGTGPGETTTLPGMRKGPTQRTNLFIQEVSGRDATVSVEFVAASGAVVDSVETPVPAFRMTRLLDRVPEGAITARIRNTGAAGSIVAYATPVDQASGDFWSVVDWNRQFGSTRLIEVETPSGKLTIPSSEEMIIPIAGSVRGANDTFFRTDVAMTNPESVAAVVRLTFRQSSGATLTEDVTLEPGAGIEYDDIVGTLFGLGTGALGSIGVDALSGAVAVNSRTFATVGGLPGSYGTGVPTVPLSAAIRLGQVQQISGIEVSSLATVQGRKPGTFRTNLGLVEASGEPARVRVSVKYADAKSLTFGALTSFEVDLDPNEAVLISDLSSRIPVTAAGKDLRNVSLEFRVIEGAGAVVAYASSIDNGTGDSILRVE